MFTLQHKVAFYVPSTTNGSTTISDTEHLGRTTEIAGALTNWFGGASIEQVQGFYKMDNGQAVTEKVHKVVAFASNEDFEQFISEVYTLAENKRVEWSQESIGIEQDSSFVLVD